jgi:hypothetical protein
MFLELKVVILVKNYSLQILGVISWGSLFIGVNVPSFVRSSDIWVTGCSCVESVTFVRKCSNISLWDRWVTVCKSLID